MLTDAVRQFIREHLQDSDLARLLLSAHRFPGIPVPEAVAQIQALRKVRGKIPAWYRFDLEFPPPLSVEQASSETAARFKAGLFSGRAMADLTGGMGVDAFFFAERFDAVTYVEQNPMLVALARENFAALGAARITCLHATAEAFLDQNNFIFDLLYLDPARRGDRQGRVFRLEDCQPDVLQLRTKLLAAAPRVLLKTAPLLDLQAAMDQLGCVTRAWVVSVDNECKEVLYLLEREAPVPSEVLITAVGLTQAAVSDPVHFAFACTRAQESRAHVACTAPQAYLYEPDAAVLKAGAFRSFGAHYGLSKLHPHTHLYTSSAWVPGVPGRAFHVEAVVKYDRKTVLQYLPEGQANIAVRNFPDSAAVVRKKLGLKDGGDHYIFAATGSDDRKILMLCRQILEKG